MSVSSLRRFAVLLAVAVFSSLIHACQSTKPLPESAKDKMYRDVFCEESNGSLSRPLICVDDQTHKTIPRSVRIHDVEASPDGNPTKHFVTVHWFTKRSASLRLEYKSPGCRVLTTPQCDQRGHCEAKVQVKLEKGAAPQSCTYGISVDKLADPDGDIIIQPCCW